MHAKWNTVRCVFVLSGALNNWQVVNLALQDASNYNLTSFLSTHFKKSTPIIAIVKPKFNSHIVQEQLATLVLNTPSMMRTCVVDALGSSGLVVPAG